MSALQRKWKCRPRVDGDPVWTLEIGILSAEVGVACPAIWEWKISVGDMPIAEGHVPVDDVADDEWDYQCVDQVQYLVERVCAALLLVWKDDLGVRP